MANVGLLAGEGKLPIIFADIAKAKGDTVIVFALKGVTDEAIGAHAHKVHWFTWGDYKKALLLLAVERIRKLIMLGKIRKEVILKEAEAFGKDAQELFEHKDGKKDYAILGKVTQALKLVGVEVLDATAYLREFVPVAGVITKRPPSAAEASDIEYGRTVAADLAKYDVGQTVTVKAKTVIALEGVEGTDETIRRAGALSGGGFVAVKMARPQQDMRFDVPLVGIATVETLIEAKGTALAIEAGKTLLIDRDEVIRLADGNNVAITII